jgi:hypothetical protein
MTRLLMRAQGVALLENLHSGNLSDYEKSTSKRAREWHRRMLLQLKLTGTIPE